MATVSPPGKIVDSFLFSEVYEKELLLLKFILEDPWINEWIVLENAYSFQGDYKGLFAEDMINSDERFAPFRSRITYITREMKPEQLDKNQVQDLKAFKVEFWQRDLAHDHFIQQYDPNDWIIISDVDEALDFTDEGRCAELFSRMKEDEQGMLHVSTKRYWFDFDNEYKNLYGIPMCTKAYLMKSGKMLHDVRYEYHSDLKMPWKQIIGFEYSSCYDAAHIMRKLATGAHMGFSEQDLRNALTCNHRVVSSKRKRRLKPTNEFLLDIIQLTPANSPRYVREHLASLKTNNIDPNYRSIRQRMHPLLFSPVYPAYEAMLGMQQLLKKKWRFFLRRIKLEKYFYG